MCERSLEAQKVIKQRTLQVGVCLQEATRCLTKDACGAAARSGVASVSGSCCLPHPSECWGQSPCLASFSVPLACELSPTPHCLFWNLLLWLWGQLLHQRECRIIVSRLHIFGKNFSLLRPHSLLCSSAKHPRPYTLTHQKPRSWPLEGPVWPEALRAREGEESAPDIFAETGCWSRWATQCLISTWERPQHSRGAEPEGRTHGGGRSSLPLPSEQAGGNEAHRGRAGEGGTGGGTEFP